MEIYPNNLHKIITCGFSIGDFFGFWDLMCIDWKLEEYVYDHYPNLGDFLYS
jgi:hypothetical protein